MGGAARVATVGNAGLRLLVERMVFNSGAYGSSARAGLMRFLWIARRELNI